MDELIKKYTVECQRIYTERTVGDYTWEGLLAMFAMEAEAFLERKQY